jgi:phage tail tape-measure protein
MYVVETLKRAVGRITGATQIEPRELQARLRRRKPSTRSKLKRPRAAKRRPPARKLAA